MMRNIKLVLQYNGKNYSGFQVQTERPTIQGEVERALSVLLREKVSIVGSGRTDAGVHALHQVVNFKTNSDISLYRFRWSANALLPSDIVISETREVGKKFNARHDAVSKEYHYFILNRKYPSILIPDFCYFLSEALDLTAMQEAANEFLGTRSFFSFCSNSGWKEEDYIKTVKKMVCLKYDDGLIKIEVKANSFLYHMVRLMVGTLIRVGLGKLEPQKIPEFFESKKKVGYLAPPQGLILADVQYPD